MRKGHPSFKTACQKPFPSFKCALCKEKALLNHSLLHFHLKTVSEVHNLKSLNPSFPSLACEMVCIQMRSTESSKFVIGPENILFAGMRVPFSVQKTYELGL